MPDTSECLTMTELARRLSLPESTVRYYCKRFAAYLPCRGEGRRRRFEPAAQEVLEFISKAIGRNKNALAVELLLRSTLSDKLLPHEHSATGKPDGDGAEHLSPEEMWLASPVASDAVAFAAPAVHPAPSGGELLLELLRRQGEALDRIADGMDAFMKKISGMEWGGSSQGAVQADMRNEEQLSRELRLLKERMDTAEAVHHNDLEQLRKWLGHLSAAVNRKP